MTRESALRTAGVCVVGFALGFVLSRIGFSDWDEVHRMFTFESFRLVLAFGFAVVLLALSWTAIRRLSQPQWAPRPYHRGSLLGGALFGVGWAVSGACPSIALVALGEGQLAAFATLLGVFVGNWAYGEMQTRWLKWPTHSCGSDL